MNTEALFGLINNTALLLALGLLYDLTTSGSGRKILNKPVLGLIIGVICMAVMTTPWLLMSGVRFDTRTIVLSVSGLFFGFTPTAIAAVIAATFRIYLGGAGAPVGVAFVICSSAIGLLWKKYRVPKTPMRSLELYLFGMTVHLVIVLTMLGLPESVRSDALSIISVPILLVFPVGTLLLGLLMLRQKDRVRISHELETERKLFSNIASTSPAGITMCDIDGNITYANDQAKKILGLEKDLILSRTYNSPGWKITDVDGNNIPDDKLPFSIVKNTGKPLYGYKHHITWPDGRKVLLSVSGAALLDISGEVTGVICIIEDITTQQAALERIDKLNRIYRIQSNINQAIIRSDHLVEVLQQACKIAVLDGGFNRVSFMEMDSDDKLKVISAYLQDSSQPHIPELCSRINNGCPAKKAIKTGRRNVISTAFIDTKKENGKDTAPEAGSACAAFPIRSEDKVVAALCLYANSHTYFEDREELQLLEKLAMDISFAWKFHNQQSLRKKAEYDLTQSELRYRNLFEKNYAVMLLIDPATGQILDANQSACNYYGWSAQVLKRMNINDINILSEEQIKNEMKSAKHEHRNHFLFKHRLASGEIRDVEVYSGPITFEDKEFLYSIVHDITDRANMEKQRDHMESQLRQSQKMEAVGRLAGGVAHDINNMLTVIIGYAENTMANLPPSTEAYQSIGEVKNAANRSARLTQQLLAFSRKQVVKPQSVDLNEIVGQHSSMLRRLIGENIALHNNLCNDLWQVFIDPSQMDQILTNLAVNARDAIHGHGDITIETSNIIVDHSGKFSTLELSQGEYVVLSVTDTGSGISKADLEHIFEPFYTTKAEGKGTGLGLSTVYGIVTQNGGTIDAYSTPGEGTTFDIYLPRYTGEKTTQKQAKTTTPVMGSHTILVAEDERQILNLTKTILSHYGYKVLTASGAREAIEIATRSTDKIDLLLTDVIMPSMNGRELQTEISQIHPEIKTLFMSGHTANIIENQGILGDDISFIHKPFSMEELANKVQEVLKLPHTVEQKTTT